MADMRRLFPITTCLLLLLTAGPAAARSLAHSSGSSGAVTLRGTLRILHTDAFKRGFSTNQFVLFTRFGRVRLSGGNGSLYKAVGRRIQIKGIAKAGGVTVR